MAVGYLWSVRAAFVRGVLVASVRVVSVQVVQVVSDLEVWVVSEEQASDPVVVDQDTLDMVVRVDMVSDRDTSDNPGMAGMAYPVDTVVQVVLA